MARFIALTTAGAHQTVVWLNADHIISMARVGPRPETTFSNALPSHTQIALCDYVAAGSPLLAVLETPETIVSLVETPRG